MTVEQMISILQIIKYDLYESKEQLISHRQTYVEVEVKYNIIKDITELISCYGSDITKKQLKDILKLECIKAYSNKEYGVLAPEYHVRYDFLKDILKLLHIKL